MAAKPTFPDSEFDTDTFFQSLGPVPLTRKKEAHSTTLAKGVSRD